MARQTLFAVLSRSPWWVSVLIAAVLFAGLRAFVPALFAASAAVPFLGIALYALWRELRARAEPGDDDARALTWADFSARLAQGFRREGYEVAELAAGPADYRLSRGGRVTLASCRRWKASQTGIEPLRELVEARRSGEADECVYVAAGEFTPQARKFAAQHRVRLLGGAELVRLLGRAGGRA